jgi:serine-type D-Ala-D-Ala carboxypeptidase/endopeptidase (penicillin-binding protein 4)
MVLGRRRRARHAAGSGAPRGRRGRWGPPFVLGAIALGAGGVGVGLEVAAAPEAPSVGADLPSVTTPVLAARRIPEVVAEPVARRRLVSDLEAWLMTTPSVACLQVVEAGEVVFSHRTDEPVVPASAQKLLTATAALLELGPDHRFRTPVLTDAPPVDGTLAGDLHLVGGGDPLLHSPDYAARFVRQPRTFTDLTRLAEAIAGAGVQRIEGAVVGDEGRYDRARYVEVWPDRYIAQNQAGPMSALAVNDGFAGYPLSAEGGGELEPADDPAANAAAVLTRLLRERGVEVAGEPRSGEVSEGASELASIESPPLLEIVDQLLVESDNETGELLLKELGLQRVGQGSTPGGAGAVEAILTEDGVDLGPAEVVDGSGLALQNRVTCALLVELLERPVTGPLVVDGLAVAGERGTLADRFAGTDLVGALRAKTGSLNSVASLTGVVDDDDGRLTFAYVANADPAGVLAPEAVLAQGTLAEILLAHPRTPDRDALGPRPVQR